MANAAICMLYLASLLALGLYSDLPVAIQHYALTDGGAAENGDPIPSEADEELFHSLLAKAGMHLANAEGDESLVHLDAEALQVDNHMSSMLILDCFRVCAALSVHMCFTSRQPACLQKA